MLNTSNLDPSLLPGAKTSAKTGDDSPTFAPPPLVPGSTTARALYEVLSGHPVVVISSPPGAGKSTLVSHVVSHLWDVTDMNIGVATVAHQAVNDLLGRIGALTGPGVVYKASGKRADDMRLPDFVEELDKNTTKRPDRLVLGRVAKSWRYSPAEVDLMVVDEAWQLTWAELSAMAKNATQVLLIGDPGQTSPIVNGAVDSWPGWDSPAAPGPVVMQQREDAVSLTMPTTFRVGPDAVQALAPLYDFTFDSGRPNRSVLGPDGSAQPELVAQRIPGDLSVVELGARVADVARSFLGKKITGLPGTEIIEPADVAVCVARNATVAAVTAALAAEGVPVNTEGGVTVNTANSLQGGQWPVVVSLDPAYGQGAVSSHTAELGRLCVMASRHMAQLCWVYDGAEDDLFSSSSLPASDIAKHLAVRRKLTENPIGSIASATDVSA